MAIEFLKQTGVMSIEYGFKGTVFTYYNHVCYDFNAVLNRLQIQRMTLTEKYPMFDQTYSIPEYVHIGKSYDFNKNDKIKSPINMTIPNDVYLPRSTNGFGSNTDNEGITRIFYEVYVKVVRKGTLFDHQKTEYFYSPIIYQGNSPDIFSEGENEAITYTDRQVFKNKIKKFYYDEKLDALVPNDMKRSHRHTGAVIQLEFYL